VLKAIVARSTRGWRSFRPLLLLVGYGLLRVSTTLFTELRGFCSRSHSARRAQDRLQVFRHCNALSLRFHLARQPAA